MNVEKQKSLYQITKIFSEGKKSIKLMHIKPTLDAEKINKTDVYKADFLNDKNWHCIQY